MLFDFENLKTKIPDLHHTCAQKVPPTELSIVMINFMGQLDMVKRCQDSW